MIPKELRDLFRIEPGDRLTFTVHNDHVGLRPARSPETLRGRFRGTGLVELLEAEREAERRRQTRR